MSPMAPANSSLDHAGQAEARTASQGVRASISSSSAPVAARAVWSAAVRGFQSPANIALATRTHDVGHGPTQPTELTPGTPKSPGLGIASDGVVCRVCGNPVNLVAPRPGPGRPTQSRDVPSPRPGHPEHTHRGTLFFPPHPGDTAGPARDRDRPRHASHRQNSEAMPSRKTLSPARTDPPRRTRAERHPPGLFLLPPTHQHHHTTHPTRQAA